MIILESQSFLKMPKGTVFAMYESGKFWELYVKGDSRTYEYWFKRIATELKDFSGDFPSDDLPNNQPLELSFNNWQAARISEEERFAVYDKNDIEGLISALEEARGGSSRAFVSGVPPKGFIPLSERKK